MNLTEQQKTDAMKALGFDVDSFVEKCMCATCQDRRTARFVETEKRLAEVGLAIQHVDASLPDLEDVQNVYTISRLESCLFNANEFLKWLDAKGGLGSDVHERIRGLIKAIQPIEKEKI
jgi:hypothetical protein